MGAKSQRTSAAITYEFQNSRTSDLVLWLEPWAEEIRVQPGSLLRLEVETLSDEPAAIQFEPWDTHLTLYASAETLVRVLVDGCLRPTSSSALPFPGLPPGKSTRDFVNLLFGGVAGMRAGGVELDSVLDRLGAPMGQGELRLEPLAEPHRDALKSACAEDREIWPIYAISYDPEHFDASFDKLLGRANGQAFAVFEGDRLAGMSAYIGIEPERGVLEIGNTYYVPGLRGTGFNRRVKDLMIRRAIDSGYRRIEFRVDSRNLRSQAAMAKLGAVREGVIRAERITWTGHVRDTVLFSILADEWPSRVE